MSENDTNNNDNNTDKQTENTSANVISTYDEYISKNSQSLIDGTDENYYTRTYVFISNSKEELYYFTLERGYFDKKSNELVMTKLPFSKP